MLMLVGSQPLMSPPRMSEQTLVHQQFQSPHPHQEIGSYSTHLLKGCKQPTSVYGHQHQRCWTHAVGHAYIDGNDEPAARLLLFAKSKLHPTYIPAWDISLTGDSGVVFRDAKTWRWMSH